MIHFKHYFKFTHLLIDFELSLTLSLSKLKLNFV